MKGGAETDYSLYLVTDRLLAGGRPLDAIVPAAVRGGVSAVQLREKNVTTREFLSQAFALKSVLSGSKIPLIINDRLDIALACEADGVHLGQEDMNCAVARRIVGAGMIIGVSVNTVDEALQAEAEGADYLGAGPVFATPTKTDASPPTGPAGLEKMRGAVSIPIVAIGGIGPGNAGEIIRAGADGVAVVSAIVASPDPETAAREIRRTVESALEMCGRHGASAKHRRRS